jgi:hypothetical protein
MEPRITVLARASSNLPASQVGQSDVRFGGWQSVWSYTVSSYCLAVTKVQTEDFMHTVVVVIYIYIYRERERERERV